MSTTFSRQLCNVTLTIAPFAASATLGSQDRGMKHAETMGKARSGSGKPQVTEGVDDARLSPSSRDGRMSRNACEAGRAQEVSRLAWIER
jgi:hypothetical protein